MNNIKAAIFDLDGTLVDSMWVWKQIDIDYLSKKGHSVPKNLNDEITHLSFSQTAEYFKNKFSLEDSIEEIMNDWNTMAYNYYTNDIKLKPGALQYLLKLKELGIKIGLATSSSMHLLTTTMPSNYLMLLLLLMKLKKVKVIQTYIYLLPKNLVLILANVWYLKI